VRFQAQPPARLCSRCLKGDQRSRQPSGRRRVVMLTPCGSSGTRRGTPRARQKVHVHHVRLGPVRIAEEGRVHLHSTRSPPAAAGPRRSCPGWTGCRSPGCRDPRDPRHRAQDVRQLLARHRTWPACQCARNDSRTARRSPAARTLVNGCFCLISAARAVRHQDAEDPVRPPRRGRPATSLASKRPSSQRGRQRNRSRFARARPRTGSGSVDHMASDRRVQPPGLLLLPGQRTTHQGQNVRLPT